MSRSARAAHAALFLGSMSWHTLSATELHAQPLPIQPGPNADQALPGLAPVAGGWTAEVAGKRARKTSFDVAAKDALLAAAEARVSNAVIAFFPTLTLSGSYTRYQRVPGPNFGTLVTPEPPVAPGLLQPGTPLAAVPVTFEIPVDYWLMQASLAFPISDYALRLSKQYAAASKNADAARFDRAASEAKAVSDGKIMFYEYVMAVAQREVLIQSKLVASQHAQDASNLFRAGRVSNADVLSSEASVAAAELAVDQADGLVQITEQQLRLATHAPPSEAATIGEDVTQALPVTSYDLATLQRAALANRAELHVLLLTAAALRDSSNNGRASQWPTVSAVGNYTYANPSPRNFLPQRDFSGYWSVGLRASWSLNDAFGGESVSNEIQARAAAVSAQFEQMRYALRLEVTQAVVAKRTADASLVTSGAQLRAAEAAYRARRDLFALGKSTNAELTESEANLLRARLAAVSARIQQRIASIRVTHAVGLDYQQ